MPSRNVIKDYVEDSYYHVYNRGVRKQPIFLDDQDYGVFLGLLKRYLSQSTPKQLNHSNYPSYRGQVELLTYCLMPNHFHLLIYQKDKNGMKQLLKSVSVSYSMYFNKRYKHVGALFQQRYRAVRIVSDPQLLHISRYIHLNPDDYRSWEWSSVGYYLGKKHADWVNPRRILELYGSVDKYVAFLNEYVSYRQNKLDE